jgi:uncharacterized membrane protein YgdD (TMEM256/DUF423 family)
MMKQTAGILGLTGVALGAFGAHGLKSLLATYGTAETWHTAVLYHLIHAVAMLALAAFAQNLTADAQRSKWLTFSARAWLCGVILFSGSLYAIALGAPKWLGAFITPAGGVAFLLGWAGLLCRERGSRGQSSP